MDLAPQQRLAGNDVDPEQRELNRWRELAALRLWVQPTRRR